MHDRLLIKQLTVFRRLGLAAMVLLVTVRIAAATDVPQVRFTVQRFQAEGDNPFSERLTRKILSPFLGEHTGLVRLEEASRALEAALKDKGFHFHRVTIPPQQLKGGLARLTVRAFRLGFVPVKGNKRFSERNIRDSLPDLASDQEINTHEVARMLQVANEHPAKKIAAFLRQGEVPDTIDARIEVREERPYSFFSSMSNTGDAETGRTRLSLGAQHSNLFDRDHTATVSYTTSPEFVKDVTQIGIHYLVPVYRFAGGLSLFYSHSEIDQGRVADFFDVSGKGNFGGISVDRTLLPVGGYSHKIKIGLQDRLFKNDTAFEGTTIGLDVRSRPISFRYAGRIEKTKAMGSFYIEYALNSGTGASNDNAAYDASRAGAETDWHLLRYGMEITLALPKEWRMNARLAGQQTDNPLIPGEQFGLGGSRSVRGFEERELSAENGQQISAELWTPAIWRNIRLVGFLDAGWSQLENPVEGTEEENEFISGTGLGFRWFWKDKASLTLDAAVALDGSDETERGDSKVHFNLLFRY